MAWLRTNARGGPRRASWRPICRARGRRGTEGLAWLLRQLAALMDRAPFVEAGSPGACATGRSGTGTPAAPAGTRLRLLPSGSDLVHGPTSRGTRAINAAGRRADPGGLSPSVGSSDSLERIASTGHRYLPA